MLDQAFLLGWRVVSLSRKRFRKYISVKGAVNF
jgi:hypothetical protein